MNRDVCEHFNPVDLPCEKCSVQKSTLREAAQQALEAMETVELDIEWRAASPTHKMLSKAITALRAALAEPQIDDPAIHFCHRFAILMECMLLSNDSNLDRYWDEAHALLGEYHKAQEWWQHQMGEPYVSGFGKD